MNTSAQNLPQIQVSPHAKILQEVGLSEITIDYHRPAVKGREVWGKLVPYGMTNLGFGTAKESPWRAGANENTVITFSDEVKINGDALPAGSYGLHMIVTEKDWAIIFSKTSTAWGSYFYDPKDDALRITVTPEKCELNEWLIYGFENLSAAYADVFLKWENLKVKFTAAFDVNSIVLERYRKTLVGAAGFRAPNFQQAAAFCVANNINLEEAEVWINHALSLQETGMSLLIKAQLMEKKGNKSEAAELEKKAYNIATEAELNTYGYNLMLQEKNIDKAIEILRLNVEKFPTSWNVYDSLAEAYGTKGDKDNAVKNYTLALDKAPEDQKERIQKAIDSFK
jgi:tetratricopeptide (TPR) repeat protein